MHASDAVDPVEHLTAASTLAGSGRWGASGTARAAGVQGWSVQLSNRDGLLDGTVTVSGSPLIRNGRVTGRIQGRGVAGTLLDAEGRQVATFTGTITESGRVHGRYQDRTGALGTWEWDQPLAE